MLQQTTVSAVVPYYDRWFKLFPDMLSLARASRQKVLKVWEGLGYYRRAVSLHRAARTMCRDNACEVPDDYKTLIALPGFGPYITAAVLSFAFGRPFPVLDANVRRVVLRLIGYRGRPGSQTDKTVLGWVRSVFPVRSAGHFNQAMMELGALVCKPRNPSCLLCPVRRSCLAFERGEQEVIPPPRKRSYQEVETVVAIIKDGQRYLIQQRPPHGLLAGLWEFPGGKREMGETLRGALRREVREELGVAVEVGRLLLKVEHAYTRFRVTLSAFQCDVLGRPKVKGGRYRWVSLRAIKSYPFPSGSARIVRFLENAQPEGPAASL
jgi:A/G-specific adenine glycosylase